MFKVGDRYRLLKPKKMYLPESLTWRVVTITQVPHPHGSFDCLDENDYGYDLEWVKKGYLEKVEDEVFKVGDKFRIIEPERMGLNHFYKKGDIIEVSEKSSFPVESFYDTEGYFYGVVWIEQGYIEKVEEKPTVKYNEKPIDEQTTEELLVECESLEEQINRMMRRIIRKKEFLANNRKEIENRKKKVIV